MAMDQQSPQAAPSEEPRRQSEALLQDLRRKLDALEDRVQAYRHDMAAEFQRYYQQTLLDAALPRDTVLTVQQTLAASLENCYPTLAPELRKQLPTVDNKPPTGIQKAHKAADSLESPSRPNSNSADVRPSPPSDFPGAVFGAPVASPTSPHEREKEFQGLFTPFFLPLLDQTPVSPSKTPASLPILAPLAPTSPSLAEPVNNVGTGLSSTSGANVATADHMQGSPRHLQGQDMEGSSDTGGVQTGSAGASQPASPSPLPGRTSDQARRSTDDILASALSTALSDQNVPQLPKSALRRSSSCSRESPRRVRFDVKGAEVLPTASPQPSDFPTPRPSSPTPTDQPRSFDEIVGDQSSIEDERPSLPPRKISSTEKLRMLSREPLDEGTTWTVVNRSSENAGGQSSVASSMSSNATWPAPTSTPSAPEPSRQTVTRQFPQVTRREEESEESSDEDFLAMAKSRSKTKKVVPVATVSSTPEQQPSGKPSTPAQKLVKKEEEKDQTSSEDYEEEDDMFHFETGGLSAPPRPKKQPQPLKDDAPEPSTPEPEAAEPVRTPMIASPGVGIPSAQTGYGPPTPTASKFQIGSLGSYKGRPVVMPVVKNPELHAQAAEQGEFNTWVGGMDGRSGVDDGDMSSFRASLAQTGFSGTPRSLSERMMLEDAMEERNQHREEDA